MKYLLQFTLCVISIIGSAFIHDLRANDFLEKTFQADMRDLFNENIDVRESAKYGLKSFRKNIGSVLLEKVKELSKNPNNTFNSQLHLSIEILGDWRIEEATFPLLEIIDYEVDKSTFPVGDKLPPTAFFPAAEALSKIGGPDLSEAILSRLSNEENEKTIRICLWVMMKSYGGPITETLIEKKMEGITDDDDLQSLMQNAKVLLKKKEMLLVFPEAN